ncbi:MAG: hypothetical protein ACXVRE_10145, partial [Gaiellaceae bacterium]
MTNERRLDGAHRGAEAAASPASGAGKARPAFYALAPGGWRDYVTLLHPPYTAWHLSYVAIGAALAPHFYPGRLAAAAAAFFLAMGIGAHALDELQGRPLATRIPRPTLVVLTVVSLAAAAAAFFLAMGISAHALDELIGRPLETRIPRRVLVALSVVPL